MKNRLKFWVKRLVTGARAVLLFVVPAPINKNDWDQRILIVDLDLIGDIVVLSGVLRHYREAFPGKKIFILLSRSVHPVFVRDFVDEVLQVDTHKFKSDSWYGFRMIKKMRSIGFATVIDQNAGTEFVEKTLVTELGARELVGYEGWRIDFDKPFNANMALGVQYFQKKILPRFTKIIPRIPEEPGAPRLRHMLEHYAAIFEGATGLKKLQYVPLVPATSDADTSVRALLAEHHLEPGSYCLLSLGTSSRKKDWPVERFIRVGQWLKEQKIPIILTGGPGDVPRAAAFEAALGGGSGTRGGVLDLVGKTSVLELVSLIRFAKIVFSNDTALTHIGVALGKPSLTVLAMGHFGRMSLYGRVDINRWVYDADAPCRCDNMRCMNTVGPTEAAPCLQTIGVEQVLDEFKKLLFSPQL